jgi:glutathione peroxidase
MMRHIAIAVVAVFLISFVAEPSIYDLSLYTVDQKLIKLEVFKGKKILFISLPAYQWNETLIKDLNSFSKRYRDKVAIVGITSNDKNYKANTDALASRLKSTLTKDIIFTPASYFEMPGTDSTRNLLKWLTYKKLNKHFDVPDFRGKRFFVDENGELYAVMGATRPLMDPGFEGIINRPRQN